MLAVGALGVLPLVVVGALGVGAWVVGALGARACVQAGFCQLDGEVRPSLGQRC